jgi:hypothetical protein
MPMGSAARRRAAVAPAMTTLRGGTKTKSYGTTKASRVPNVDLDAVDEDGDGECTRRMM